MPFRRHPEGLRVLHGIIEPTDGITSFPILAHPK